jgi:hypothetical protein
MNTVQAGYELLLLLAISDNNYHSREVAKINLFVEINFKSNVDYSIGKLYNDIINLDAEQRLQHLLKIAEYFKDDRNIRNKLRMINFALELIIADHKVTNEEKYRFKILGQYWDINLERFINKKLNKITES